jgi:hypothetical protein
VLNAVRNRRRLLTRSLYVGLALIVGGFMYRSISLMTAFSVVSGDISDEKSERLASAVSAAMVANYVMAIGGLITAGCGAALIARTIGRKDSSRSRDDAP